MFIVSAVAGALGLIAAAAPPRVVTVKAYDYRFESPATIPAGTVTFRLQNVGKEIHHLWIVQLAKGKSPDDFLAAANKWGSALKMPSWAVEVGGPNSAAAGESADGTLTLTPATYMLVCWIPSPDGMLHIMKGMVRPLRVTAAGATKPDEPTPDVTMTMTDYAFALSAPIVPGTHTIRIENKAAQTHEAVIALLAPGKTVAQAVTWMHGGQLGPSPVSPIGGASGLANGRHMFITADFQAGTYVLLCFVPDAKDGKPHSDHGMLKEIAVVAP